MTPRGILIASFLTALACAPADAALGQVAPAAPAAPAATPGVVVSTFSDIAEAEQADRDRDEAEAYDFIRRIRRRPGVPMVPEDHEQEAWRREAYRDWSACVARLSAEQAVVVEQLRAGTELSIQSIRDSANGGNVAVAVEEQRRQRDQLIEAVLGGHCP